MTKRWRLLLLLLQLQVESAIETYERILRVVPDHKEAVDSLLFLRGRPKDAPPLRDDMQGRARVSLLAPSYL